jgi:hypothetical protein
MTTHFTNPSSGELWTYRKWDTFKSVPLIRAAAICQATRLNNLRTWEVLIVSDLQRGYDVTINPVQVREMSPEWQNGEIRAACKG